ncbi:AP2-like ethylene-responsive transcription factor family [Quillaja saponaria]|uniref:AP2-like ethylene-responsive transcription factor family n=1 Tax=Quillaja saponaria TaxID=32244 RepID=A0AAD7VI84_QUISA|nr:AP2-like ethylene-responsive transcription factor family [Quillaja saponaria]
MQTPLVLVSSVSPDSLTLRVRDLAFGSIMASSSSEPSLKSEVGCGSSGGGGVAETSETAMANDQLLLYRGLKKAKKERGCTAKERISKMLPCAAGKRSSIYRGVTRHRWTGRYEAHLWDKSTWNQNQNKKGKQVYLGAYDDEEAAARAYDLAALKYWGPGTLINFPVTDYTRDLDEMQNVSREEYLASLRRKSSGFSRGISKYRGLASSRWESSFHHMAGSEYFNSMHYSTGDDSAAESDYVSGFCVERKIDLTSYIKWWGSNKTRQSDGGAKSSEVKKQGFYGDIGSEIKTLEQEITVESFQMPHLGVPCEGNKKKGSTVPALSILLRSAAYKSLQEKASKKHENNTDTDENENKSTINKLDRGKAVEKCMNHDGGNESIQAALGMSGALSLQGNVFPLTPFLSAPLLTNYSFVDPLVDPALWASLGPSLPTAIYRTAEVAKTETSSTYPIFRMEE